MNKKNIVIALLLFMLAALIVSVDSKYYVYYFYRALNGNNIPMFDRELASGFFFYKKDKDSDLIVFHRDLGEIPLYIDVNRPNEYAGFLSRGLVDIRLKNSKCAVYEDKTSPKNIYIEYDADISAILGVDEALEKDLLILCDMLKQKEN